MDGTTALLLVFLAGLATCLATGLGALPFFFVDELAARTTVALWAVAAGIMSAASVFGLVFEGLVWGTPAELGVGLLIGAGVVVAGQRLLAGRDFSPEQYEAADFRTLVLVLGVLTVHSFPEGVAVGVAFAELGLVEGVDPVGLGFGVPVLAVFMTAAIGIQNVPEGVAVSIPLHDMGASRAKMVWWAVFSSLPQPIAAVVAFRFVRAAETLLPVGFGFAAGAMLYLVVDELIPEARERGASLPDGGTRALVAGFVGGVGIMVPLLFV